MFIGSWSRTSEVNESFAIEFDEKKVSQFPVVSSTHSSS